ncbi:hypothetical protein HYH03_011516 [Edaphochlamys debaryana]|uniref:Uncharacterized protein n=1 Tax=Edaphochlamys debaryana TaxID=47281 RepID=A0A835XTX4_9CHLO|nr:hypothetical protein HYH03_011516 [Edaphochlamys debaryana]|eukprot:KAG2490051.1 hypothetical protein HYH03_011516 [Edaphochlamys debaryana]
MPRLRQRIVYCDCFDCVDRPEATALSQAQLDAATAVARQEPPPKALVIFASGVIVPHVDETGTAVTTLDTCTLPHCNLVVREGNLGMLAVRPSKEATDAGIPASVLELSQLLGVYPDVLRQPQAMTSEPPAEGDAGQPGPAPSLPSLAARFKGMQAAFASTSAPAGHLAARLGMDLPGRLSELLQRRGGPQQAGAENGGVAAAAEGAAAAQEEAGQGKEKQKEGAAALGLPAAAEVAEAAVAELGAADGGSGRDLLLLHLHLGDLLPAGASGDAVWEGACEALEWLDGLTRALLGKQEVRERTLLTLVLSPGGHALPPVPNSSIPSTSASASTSGGPLVPGGPGVQLDPAAAIVTPHNAGQLGRSAAAAAAAVAAAAGGAGGAGGGGAAAALSLLDAADPGLGAADPDSSTAAAAPAAPAAYPLVSRPLQSFEFLGLERLAVDVRAPLLVARRLPGVVRRDHAQRLAVKEAVAAGGMGAIAADRLLHELAYKLARAPKYGA